MHELAEKLAAEHGAAERLKQCDAMFEVGPYDPSDAALIRRVADALQEKTEGYVYQSWDKRLRE